MKMSHLRLVFSIASAAVAFIGLLALALCVWFPFKKALLYALLVPLYSFGPLLILIQIRHVKEMFLTIGSLFKIISKEFLFPFLMIFSAVVVFSFLLGPLFGIIIGALLIFSIC